MGGLGARLCAQLDQARERAAHNVKLMQWQWGKDVHVHPACIHIFALFCNIVSSQPRK